MYQIEVQARLLILMKKFPDFFIALPSFYSVLIMPARLFGPTLNTYHYEAKIDFFLIFMLIKFLERTLQYTESLIFLLMKI